MVVRFSSKKWKFSDRVERAFYDYGRLSAAHPMICLSISIITILFLSYPALSKLGIPISSPMDVYWATPEEILNSISAPDWLINRTPALHIQQIIVKASVEPWFGNLSASVAVRASISESFHLLKILNETKSQDELALNDLCYHGILENQGLSGILPQKACIILSPSLFWHNNLDFFEKDQNILNTIFKYSCSPTMCPRDILLGTPTRLTGIKQIYRTNRHRSIEYAITLIQQEFNPEWHKALSNKLEDKYKIVKSNVLDEETFTYVFYKPRKYVSDYLPLLCSYLFCALYFYYTVNKFQMVKSKPGLALAAFITVLTTLSSTAGICANFELNASLWRSSVLPYLAMILGLENIMCITRSVVYTPPSLDVPSRLSHGLSLEGFSITKYFLLELSFLFIGYFTRISQIQEFCLFAFIGIVVDLYMQLFFYVPCLAFDLYRLDREDKQRFSLMLFDTDIRQLKNYPNPRCPARHFIPSLFARKNRLVRTHSETGISKNDGSTTISYKGHRRSASSDKHVILKTGSLVSNRLRLLYFWTKTRIVQRLIMAFFCLWVIWLAFIVHKSQVFEGLFGASSNGTADRNSPWISHYFFDTAPLEFGDWQRQTFRWWPALLAEYNFSLSAQYITFLPPIVLQATISAFDPILTPKRIESENTYSINDNLDYGEESGPELKNRVFWLERQMTTMLVISAIIPFTIVALFTLYTCFWDKLSIYRQARMSAEILKADKKRALTDKKGFVELAPLAFSRHDSPIECASIDPPNTIVSASVNGHVFIWDSRSGELRNSIQRAPRSQLNQPSSFQTPQNQQPRPSNTPNQQSQNSTIQQRKRADSSASFVPSEPNPTSTLTSIQDPNLIKLPKSLVWCLAVRNNIIALGCSTGIIQLANSKSSRLIGTFNESNSTSGVIHIELRGNRIIFVRLNGVLEIVEFRLIDGAIEERAEFIRLTASRLHKKPVTKLLCSTFQVITASYDQTLRIFNSREMFISHTLNGHAAAVVSACVSEEERLLFSSCDAGRICCWSLEDGQLLRSVDRTVKQFLELSCTRSILIGFGGGRLWLWDLKEGGTIAELSLNEQVQPLTLLLDVDDGIDQSLKGGLLAVLSDQHIVTSEAESIQIWDLQLKAIVKQVRLPGFVDSVQRLDDKSALCCSGTEMFCVSIPVHR